MIRRSILLPLVSVLLLSTASLSAEEPAAAESMATAEKVAESKKKLATFQNLVGTWRGVGQPQRGSTRGAWIEQSEWQWQFDSGSAALSFKAPEAKYLAEGQITAGPEAGSYVLTAETPVVDKPVRYSGKAEDETLTLEAEEAVDGLPSRITLRTVADGKRLVVLYESRIGDTERFTRMAEVGYTRRGSGFGQGVQYTECVVTGGYADRYVDYNGTRYPVCCEGCRDLFLMDPEGVLAEYRARVAERENATPE